MENSRLLDAHGNKPEDSCWRHHISWIQDTDQMGTELEAIPRWLVPEAAAQAAGGEKDHTQM